MVETGWGCFSQLVEPGKRARSGGEARCCSSKSMRRLVAPRTRGSEQNPRHLLGLYRQWRTDPDFPRQPNEPRRHRPAVRSGAETGEGPEVSRRERLRKLIAQLRSAGSLRLRNKPRSRGGAAMARSLPAAMRDAASDCSEKSRPRSGAETGEGPEVSRRERLRKLIAQLR